MTLTKINGQIYNIKPGADLYDVNLAGVNLAGANLTEAKLRAANLAGAKLRGADFSSLLSRKWGTPRN